MLTEGNQSYPDSLEQISDIYISTFITLAANEDLIENPFLLSFFYQLFRYQSSMSIRTFTFCDVCNPLGIRCPEQRRDVHRDPLIGRRHTDGRAWIEGDSEFAIESGWVNDGENHYICPGCSERGLEATDLGIRKSEPRTFVFCDRCNRQAYRFVEYRRSGSRFEKSGRRITDGRAWIETPTTQNLNSNGWTETEDNNHFCPQCAAQIPIEER